MKNKQQSIRDIITARADALGRPRPSPPAPETITAFLEAAEQVHFPKELEMNAPKTLKVELQHTSSIPSARWCRPVGWEPTNQIDGAEFAAGSWWSEDSESAGLVWFGDINAYGAGETIDASLEDLRVASCGDCRVIGNVLT